MNIPALIRNCFLGALVWVIICLGALGVANMAFGDEPGQPFMVSAYCTTQGKMAALLTGKVVEYGCFRGARMPSTFVRSVGVIKASDGNNYVIIELAPDNHHEYKRVYSYKRVSGTTS
jgi:hypothetical protein